MSCVSALVKYLSANRYAELTIRQSAWHCDAGFGNSAVPIYRGRAYAYVAPLSLEEWDWIGHSLDATEGTERGLQCRLIVELLYYGGLRTREIADLSIDDARRLPCEEISSWCLRVRGRHECRGGELFVAPAPLSCTLDRWARTQENLAVANFGLKLDRQQGSSAPLVGMSAVCLPYAIKTVIRHASRLADDAGNTAVAERLKTRTAISLRYACYEHSRDAGRSS